MKHTTAISIMLALLFQTFSKTLVVADYFLNTVSYARNCVNKASPKMHCNGKCQMMKKIKQQENKDQQNPERKSENKNQALSSKSYFATFTYADIRSLFSKKIALSSNEPTIDRCFDIFHTPQASRL